MAGGSPGGQPVGGVDGRLTSPQVGGRLCQARGSLQESGLWWGREAFRGDHLDLLWMVVRGHLNRVLPASCVTGPWASDHGGHPSPNPPLGPCGEAGPGLLIAGWPANYWPGEQHVQGALRQPGQTLAVGEAGVPPGTSVPWAVSEPRARAWPPTFPEGALGCTELLPRRV